MTTQSLVRLIGYTPQGAPILALTEVSAIDGVVLHWGGELYCFATTPEAFYAPGRRTGVPLEAIHQMITEQPGFNADTSDPMFGFLAVPEEQAPELYADARREISAALS